ncbi:MAG: LysM peptidoglycan-binding domain-containing protein [Phycisphaerales bacterium]|nr:LysM peptidoglycan-binding domain-containing protein [Phycisphaerales bacterium]
MVLFQGETEMKRARRPGRELAARATALTAFVVVAALAMATWRGMDRAPVRAAHAQKQPGVQDSALAVAPVVPADAATQPAPIAPPETPIAACPPAPSNLERAKAAGVTVRVKKGETLISLAADHLGSPDRWRELLEVNADKFTTPERLQAGMLIRLPEGVRPATAEEIRVSRFRRSIKDLRFDWYVVRSGDTLASIALDHYGDASKAAWVANANADTFPTPPDPAQPLTEGQRLRVPREYVVGSGCSG